MLPNLAIPLALGVLAAMANVFGGLVLTGRDWERRYLRYFIALGAGFMLAAVLLEMLPQSMALRPGSAGSFFSPSSCTKFPRVSPWPRSCSLQEGATAPRWPPPWCWVRLRFWAWPPCLSFRSACPRP